MNREAAIAPYSSLCYRFCTSFEPKPQEIVMALFTKEESLAYHEEPRPGKLEVLPVKPCFTQKDLSMAYSPGVANACLAIADDPSLANAYTGRGNLVAVVSNGTAVLGLGNIGPLAGKPVMEGKSVLFKAFADVNAYDINLALTDPDKIIEVVKALEPTFGGINLEDIKAPECFYIEEVLKKEMNIPVFHDDQHGTAIISGAGLINALEITGKKAEDFIVVVSGAGAAAIACAKFYTELGIDPANIRMFDSKGILHKGRTDLNKYKAQFALSEDMTMTEALKGADLFLGLSKKDLLTPDMIKGMADHPVIFACANPDPEIAYPLAMETRPDCIMGTGRTDFPNQINNLSGFPYIFRGALDVYATEINEAMKLAAARALAALAKEPVPAEVSAAYQGQTFSFGQGYVIPKPFDPRLIEWLPPAVAQAAMDTGVARKPIEDMDAYKASLRVRIQKAQGRANALIESYGGRKPFWREGSFPFSVAGTPLLFLPRRPVPSGPVPAFAGPGETRHSSGRRPSYGCSDCAGGFVGRQGRHIQFACRQCGVDRQPPEASRDDVGLPDAVPYVAFQPFPQSLLRADE